MVNCPVCNSSTEFYFKSGDLNYHTTDKEFTLYRCEKCEAIFQNPIPTEEEIKKYYPDEYHPHKEDNKNDSAWKSFLKQKRDSLYENNISPYFFLAPFKDPKIDFLVNNVGGETISHLDVGCGAGKFLEDARKFLNVDKSIGIDFDARAVEVADKKSNLEAYETDLQSFNYDEKFDLITVNHVLEHIPAPNQFIQEIHKRLEENGRLLMSLPNTGGLGKKMFEKYWVGYEVPRHVIDYSKKAVSELLQSNSFEILEHKTTSLYLDSIKPLLGYKRHEFKLPMQGTLQKMLGQLSGLFSIGDNQIILARKMTNNE